MVDNMFTAPDDMRRVVLCRDCEYYGNIRKSAAPICMLMRGLVDAGPEDYCSYGKRGNEEDAIWGSTQKHTEST